VASGATFFKMERISLNFSWAKEGDAFIYSSTFAGLIFDIWIIGLFIINKFTLAYVASIVI
jgi:hypothetical protein